MTLPALSSDPGASRILIAGSPAWTDKRAVALAICDAIAEFGQDVLVLGDHGFRQLLWDQVTVVHRVTQRGADTMAARIATAWGMVSESHRLSWSEYGPLVVSHGAHVCLAFGISKSSNVARTVRAAQAAEIPVRQYETGSKS